ncbi:MAG: NmrA family NAD(P)-binding protein [Gammaproteobacteria bacterium WSBS_2016_MAG_OTU1]
MTISKTPLILGASGMCVTALAQLLGKAKFSPRVSYQDDDEMMILQNIQAESVSTNCNDVESLVKAMSDTTVAALILPLNADMAAWGHNTIAAAKKAGLERLVLLVNNNANEQSDHDLPRMQGEIIAELQQSGVPYQIVKAAPYFQHVFFSNIALVRRHEFSLPIGGEIGLPYIDMHDIVIFIAKLLCEEHPVNKVYNVTGGSAIPLSRMARFIGKVILHDVQYFPIRTSDSLQIFLTMGIPNWLGKSITDLYSEYSTGNYTATTTDFKELVGRAPIGAEKCFEKNLTMLRDDAIPAELLKTGN